MAMKTKQKFLVSSLKTSCIRHSPVGEILSTMYHTFQVANVFVAMFLPMWTSVFFLLLLFEIVAIIVPAAACFV